MEIYEPREDSFLFVEFLKNYFSKISKKELSILEYLDMGCGSAILSETASGFLSKKSILAADINPLAVRLAKQKGFNSKVSDLFSKIPKTKKFDLITFNAPYLPEEEKEPSDSRLITTGGKRGDEIPLKFLKQAKTYLAPSGKILLLISSLTPLNRINKFRPKIVAEKKIFFENLLILEFS